MTGGGRAGSLTQAWSVDVAGLSEVVGLNVAAVGGGASVTVHGSSMGKTGYTGRGRGGRTGCEGTEWVSASAVRCRASGSTGGSRRAMLTVGRRAGSLTQAWSVDVAGFSAVGNFGNVAVVNPSSVTVSGVGWGLVSFSVSARLGVSSIVQTRWFSDSSLSCVPSSGMIRTSGFVITSAVLLGSRSDAFSYELQISSLKRVNFAVNVVSVISTFGSGFGQVEGSMNVRLHFTSSRTTAWVSTSSINCQVSTGSGQSFRTSVTANIIAASTSNVVSFDSHMGRSLSAVNLLPAGDRMLTVFGFGFSDSLVSLNARILQTGCSATVWISVTSLKIKVLFFESISNSKIR